MSQSNVPQWEVCKKEFDVYDGSLRDIYVFDTTIEHWQKLYATFRAKYQLEYTVDGEVQPLPDSVKDIFPIHEVAHPALYFDIGKVVVGCHFFVQAEIEFDIAAREINSEKAFATLLDFMRLLGDVTQKTVILTYDSDEEHPIISYLPGEEKLRYHYEVS